jgi:ATP-dependent protease ClpP protease subunit
MARGNPDIKMPAELANPQIVLLGEVDEQMAADLRDKLRALDECDGPIAVEITTPGGDAEMARRMTKDIDDARERRKPGRLVFCGKTMVYSAGVTLMAACPREDRFLSEDAMLLIHCRQLSKTVELDGPVRGSIPKVKALLHQLETGLELEKSNFERLIAGSDVSMNELLEKALYNWYLPAAEAVERGLVAGIAKT